MTTKRTNHPLRRITGSCWEVMGEIEHLGETIELRRKLEILECGHKVSPRQDMYGETNATKRRCLECPARDSQ